MIIALFCIQYYDAKLVFLTEHNFVLSSVCIQWTHFLYILETFVSGFHNQMIAAQNADKLVAVSGSADKGFCSSKLISLKVAGFHHLSVNSAVSLYFLLVGSPANFLSVT